MRVGSASRWKTGPSTRGASSPWQSEKPPPQLSHRKSIDRFKAAKLVANILAHFPPNVRAAILQMALAGETERQVELPALAPGKSGPA